MREILLDGNAILVALVKSRPSTTGVEFAIGGVNRVTASAASKMTFLRVKTFIFTGSWVFCTLGTHDVEFLSSEDLAPFGVGHGLGILADGDFGKG